VGHPPGAATAVAAVIGDPIAHSRSPAICNAAFDALGLDWVYVAFRVAEGDAAEAVQSMRALGIRGLSVTMPHKAAVIPALDALDASAERLGAVNCIAQRDGRLVGHNTDGAGFLRALAAEGHEVAGARCVVLGAEELPGADLLVNATPVGMRPGDGSPVEPALLGPHLVVNDLVYQPPVTPLMAAAAESGAAVVGGLGMLVHQAAAAVRIWTGREPPLGAMSAAAAGGP
jgi:shikimate dehydrogenase